MREIKFRVWDKSWGGMFLYSPMDGDDKAHDLENESGTRWEIFCRQLRYFQRSTIPYTLMQFTGLKDKNGREIYEGDIVRFTYASTPPEDVSGVVEWSDEYCGWRFANYLIEPTPRKTIEVIGNIYENPDLIR